MGRTPSFHLSDEEIAKLENRLADANRDNDLAVHRRVRALLLVGRDGCTRLSAATQVGVEEAILYRWQQRFRKWGVDGMATRKAPGKPCRLAPEQLSQLASLIGGGPEEAGLDTGCWNAPIVAKLIKQLFGMEYSASQVRRTLRKLKFSYQVPKKRLAKADPEKQSE